MNEPLRIDYARSSCRANRRQTTGRSRHGDQHVVHRIGFLGATAVVAAPIDVFADWQPRLEPFFSIERCTGVPDFRLIQTPQTPRPSTNEDEARAENRDLHCDMQGSVVAETATRLRIAVPDLRAEYLVERSSKGFRFDLLYEELSDSVTLDLLRLVRGMLIARLETAGHLKLHMAAAAFGQHALAFVGGEGAGKTSALIATLMTVRHAGFVANDKVLLDRLSHGLLLRGLPLAVSIRWPTYPWLPPGLRESGESRSADRLVWPRTLTTAVGATIVPVARLRALVHVGIDLDATALSITPLTDATVKEHILRRSIFEFSDKVTPHWLLQWLEPSRARATQTEIGEQIARLPWWSMSGHPWRGDLEGALARILK